MGEHPEGALGNNPLPGTFNVGETENLPMHDHLNAIPDSTEQTLQNVVGKSGVVCACRIIYIIQFYSKTF